MTPQIAGEQPLTVLHLCAWAQVGVLVRVAVGNLFGGACGSLDPWVSCVTSSGSTRGGALFIDLPINVLGSFIMGLLSSTEQLASVYHHTCPAKASLAAWPTDSPLQAHTPLLVGLRTGLCGSLTTFASWMLQMVSMLVGEPHQPHSTHQSQWVAALLGIFIGTAIALASLVLGQHVALSIHNLLNRHHTVAAGSRDSSTQVAVKSPVEGDVAPSQLLQGQQPPAETIILISSNGDTSGTVAGSSILVEDSVQGNSLYQQPTPADQCISMQESAAAQPEVPCGSPGHRAGTVLTHRHHQHTPTDASSTKQAGATLLHTPAATQQQQLSPRSTRLLPCVAADLSAAGILLLLTAIGIWQLCERLAGASGTQFNTLALWVAMLMAPLGCLARFYLSRLNGSLRGSWAWFPAGTFTANIGACVLDFVMKVLLLYHSPNEPSGAVLAAVVTGVGGCLSTVSTWVVEIQKLLMDVRQHHRAYLYMVGSIATAVVLGLLIYGVPVWTLL